MKKSRLLKTTKKDKLIYFMSKHSEPTIQEVLVYTDISSFESLRGTVSRYALPYYTKFGRMLHNEK